ncbi:hypothetical protein CNMCM5793_008333 [Aspergillus hiratsukae]|jgi:hypothetical protein|uniref:NYN domain-containing protein n=2 Tax=Aspergillus subgen. Fumigati TaxID=2720872 RepID=A0A8H6P7E3_9EURO|nr:hypothetical protein CNMCM5793_008333 [Aspergillus hiratsukae]KAH1551908.1 hypothetical protein KXX37_009594 [Aspergillus fumigatus]KAH1646712.1 hypothetical protein KXX59_007628 [Aspergillus fumigatus]KAH1893032.1 hypothetical protein KXV57_003461 [Aspergillus fumigatus]KAH1992838.1 hypothetical protein KXV33_005119 [Aspergillus fumigatus]
MVGDNISKTAVLIDAENARSSIDNQLLSEITKYGTAHAKRACGDWTKPNLQGRKGKLLEQSIQPIQQFAYTHGKNATDSAMIKTRWISCTLAGMMDSALSQATVTSPGWLLESASQD